MPGQDQYGVVGEDQIIRPEMHARLPDRLDLGKRQIAPQFDGQSLTMASHRSNAHAKAIDRNAARRPERRTTENLVALGTALPLFHALAMLDRHIDPGDQTAGQRHAPKVVGRQARRTHRIGNLAVDLEDGTCRIGKVISDRRVQRAHLRNQFAHVLGTGAAGCLIGHGRHPLDQVMLE